MKLNKIKALVPVTAALLLSAGMTSCMDDLSKGNIDPTVEATASLDGLYSKCYAGLIMEGNDGSADFTIDDAGKSTLLRNLYNFNELPTDEGICWWSDGGITDICYNQCESSNATLKNLYYRLMSNMTYCNQFLETFGDTDPTKAAEVRFIRAYNAYQLLDMFGDPSFTDKIISTTPLQAHMQNPEYDATKTYTRHELLMLGRKFLFDWVETELKTAADGMLAPSPKTDSNADYGRADKAAAWLMLSRLYLNAGTYLNDDGQNNPYWQQAADYANKVIKESGYKLFNGTAHVWSSARHNSYTDSDLINGTQTVNEKYTENGETKTEVVPVTRVDYKAYDMLFMGDNGSNGASCEAVLPLLQDGVTTQGWGGSLFFIAAMWNDKMYTVGNLGAGTTGNNWSGMRVRPQFVEKFTSTPSSFVNKTTQEIRALNLDDRALLWGCGSSSDKRTLELVDADGKINGGFYTGLTMTKWNNNYSNGGTPHDTYNVDIDFFLLRVAEAYLNAAEADYHIGSASAKTEADGYIKALRDRAHASATGYGLDSKVSGDNLNILAERSRELYGEGLRRPDLIRCNQFGGPQATYKWSLKGSGTSLDGVSFSKYRNVYPIPSSEISANQSLIQIDGYNEVQ